MDQSHLKFKNSFPVILDDLIAEAKSINSPENILKWYQQLLEHIVQGPMLLHGTFVGYAASKFLGRDLDNTEAAQSVAIGWILEIMQAFHAVSDDVIDPSVTQNASASRFQTVGTVALNDAILLESSIFVLIKKYFKGLPLYLDFVDLFHDMLFQYQLQRLSTKRNNGLQLDFVSSESGVGLDNFRPSTESLYNPLVIALLLTGLRNDSNMETSRRIMFAIEDYTQLHAEFLSYFGDSQAGAETFKKFQPRRHSWFFSQALLLASDQQQELLCQNYGRNGKSRDIVKSVFQDLRLKEMSWNHCNNVLERVKLRIAEVEEKHGLKRSLFELVLQLAVDNVA